MKIKEDYCSYELSKLLKEKGFDGEIHTTFDKEGYTQASITHQMAMKWLREEYNIFIDIRRSLNTYLYGSIIRKDPSDTFSKISEQFETYEDAVEAALKHTLEKLI